GWGRRGGRGRGGGGAPGAPGPPSAGLVPGDPGRARRAASGAAGAPVTGAAWARLACIPANPCHHCPDAGGECARLDPVTPSPPRNDTAHTSRRARVRDQVALGRRGDARAVAGEEGETAGIPWPTSSLASTVAEHSQASERCWAG